MVLCVAHCVYVVKLSHSLSTIRHDPWKEISKIVPQVAPPWVVDTWPGGIVPVKRLLLFLVFMPLIAAQGQISEGKQCTTAIRYLCTPSGRALNDSGLIGFAECPLAVYDTSHSCNFV